MIAIVELVEQRNLRLTTNIVGCPPEAVRIGMPVKVRFRTVTDEIALPVFEPDDAPRPDPAALRTTPETPPKHTDTAEVAARPPRRVAPEERLERRAILSGVGQSAIGRRLFRTDMDLTVEAALRAIADAGLDARRRRRHRCLSRCHGRGARGLRGPRHRRRAGRARALGELVSRGARGAGTDRTGHLGGAGGRRGPRAARAGVPHGQRGDGRGGHGPARDRRRARAASAASAPT